MKNTLIAIFVSIALSGCESLSEFPRVDVTVQNRAYVLVDHPKEQIITVTQESLWPLRMPNLPDSRAAVRAFFKQAGRQCVPVDGSLMESTYYEFTYKCKK